MSDETPKDAEVEETPEAEVEVEETPEAEVEVEVEETPEVDAEVEETPEAEAEVEVEETPEPEVEEAPAAEEKPKPRRRSRSKEPEAPAAAPAPARKRPAPGERVVVRAQAKYVRTSARKARLVCDHIRGKSVLEARAILALTPRHVARDWSKLLESAVANAENNHELIGDELRIASVTADEGPTLKRFRPRAMGRATRIRKRTSHLTILLTPKES
jgi:ribosomal protein L22